MLMGLGTSDYVGLDANGNTPQDIACLKDPNCDMTAYLARLLGEDLTGEGRGALPCGTAENPTCGPKPGSLFLGIPIWGWLVGGALGIIVLKKI